MNNFMKTILVVSILGAAVLCAFGITPVELNKRIQSGDNITIVDVRFNELYQKGHIPGAINIPAAICDQKRIPKAQFIVVYDDGLFESSALEAVEKLRKNNNAKIEILEGGFAAWETFVGKTTAARGVKREEVPYITYEALKKLQSSDTVIVDLREPSRQTSSSLAGAPTQPAPVFTDLQKEFPKAKVVKSPFDAGVSKKSLSAAQYSPIFVLVDNGDGKALEVARTLKANGIYRYVVLAGGEKILERQGKSGLQRSGASFTAPASLNKNN